MHAAEISGEDGVAWSRDASRSVAFVFSSSTTPRNILQAEDSDSASQERAAISMVVEASATPGQFLERSRVYSTPNMNVQLVGVPGGEHKFATALNGSNADTAAWLATSGVVAPPSRDDESFQNVRKVRRKAVLVYHDRHDRQGCCVLCTPACTPALGIAPQFSQACIVTLWRKAMVPIAA